MKKILMLFSLVLLGLSLACCKAPDFSFREGSVFIINGMSQEEIARLDVGAYRTTVTVSGSDFSLHSPAEIIVYEADYGGTENDGKIYVLKIMGGFDNKYTLNKYLFTE